MTIVQGYLVVLKCRQDIIRTSPNKRYRGLYRMPPWSQEDYEAGFNDPYMEPGIASEEEGLIPTLELAQEVKRRLLAWYSQDEFEIIFARQCNEGEALRDSHLVFLGYDIACYAPFWSIMVDPPDDPAADRFMTMVNEHGLMPTFEMAKEYHRTYCAKWLRDPAILLWIWEVYLASRRVPVLVPR